MQAGRTAEDLADEAGHSVTVYELRKEVRLNNM